MRNYQLEVSHHQSNFREPKKSVIQQPPPIEMVSSSLPLVKDRGEWNQQTFIIRPRFEKKNYPAVDNQLEIQFPVHRDFDFVANHALGFKGKGNVDLFKFYYRLYLKNKFAIQKIRKDKKIQVDRKEKVKQENIRKQQINQTEEPNTDEIRNACKAIEIRPPTQQKQLKFVRKCLKNLQKQAKVLSKHVELPKIQQQVNIITMDASKIPQARNLDQRLELEELMLSRVIQAIQESESVSHEDVKLVRGIIERRQEQLSEIERQLQLSQLIGIKKQIYEREQILKNEAARPPGIDNPENFNELSSIQELSIFKSHPNRSQPNVSVVEYRFNSYENEDELPRVSNELQQQQKQGEESVIQEQSTEMQSILQQVRSTSLAVKGNETETSKERITDKTNNKLLPTLKFLEQAKQQIAQRSENESQQLQPYFQPEITETSKSKAQQSLSLVSQLNSKNNKTNKSNMNQSSSSHHNTLSQDKKYQDPMRKSGYKEIEEQKARSSLKELDQSDEMNFGGDNYYEMKFTQILQRVIDKKKQQQGDDSQVNISQTLSQVESEAVQKITQNLVASILQMNKNPTPVMDQPSTFNYLDLDSDDQEKVTESVPELKQNEEQQVLQQRHLSYNRDISHLDHTFKIESQVSLSEKKLNEEQIANIIQQISQQLQQAKMPASQIAKQLDDVANILLKHPLNKLSTKLLRQTTITQNEPYKKVYIEETKFPTKAPKPVQREQIDYMKFYEENAPVKQEKSKKSYKLNDSSKRSKQSVKTMTEEERNQFLASHKMNLQVRANEEEMDQELQFLQTVIGDQKKQREQIFKQKLSQPLESGKNSSRDNIDFEDHSEQQQNTFRSHNPQIHINSDMDQKIQGQTDMNFNIRRPQIKQKTDSNSIKSDSRQQFHSNTNITSRTDQILPSKSKRQNEDDPQFNLQLIEQSQKSSQRSKETQKKSSSKQGTQQKEDIRSANQSVEEVPHEEEQDKQSIQELKEQPQNENEGEIQIEQIEQRYENGNVVVTSKRQKQKTEINQQEQQITDRSKHSKQSSENQQKISPRNITPQQIQQAPQHQEAKHQQGLSQPLSQLDNDTPDRQIKLNFQSSDSNLNNNSNIDQTNTPFSQQLIRNRVDLQNIQLKSYQPSLNQSPQLNSSSNNTPLQPQQQTRKQGGKNAKNQIDDSKGSSGNTPQGRFQRVKTKLSKFQEAANNDDDYDDYDWDDDDPNNKKKKITSKSSKSTLRNELQSPSISPMAKQQQLQAQMAKKKVYDLKLEYELIARQNLSLADLKRDIEKKITQLQNPDDEAKYNIYLFEQRQKQLKNLPHTIEGLVNDKRENEDGCGDAIRKFHENRMKYKDVIEKDQALKFTNQIQLDDDQQTQINTQSHLDEYMREVQMNIQRMIQQVQLEQMRDHPEVRKECFEFDTAIINQRREESLQSEVRQDQAQMKIYEEPSLETKRKTEFSEIDTVLSDEMDKKFELLARKLKNLKKNNPEKFNQIVKTEIVKSDLYLQTTKYKYILE